MTKTPIRTSPPAANYVNTGTANHTIKGTDWVDVIVDRGGDDEIISKGGNDKITAIGGGDLILSGTGYDTVSYTSTAFARQSSYVDLGSEADVFTGQNFWGSIFGGSGADRITVENGSVRKFAVIDGGADDDTIVVKGAATMIYDGTGDDSVTVSGLAAKNGAMFMVGEGHDIFTVGLEADTFVFNSRNSGVDTIKGFITHSQAAMTRGAVGDLIHINNGDYASFAELRADLLQVGTDVILTGDFETVIFKNHLVADFTAKDFDFVRFDF